MANRHSVQAKAKGGGVAPKHDAKKESYNAKGSKIVKEAEEEKRGGKVKKKAAGGEVEAKACGGKAMGRLDKRARGGGVGSGSDMKSSPWSGAHFKTNGDAGK